jgi:hypothetical protein
VESSPTDPLGAASSKRARWRLVASRRIHLEIKQLVARYAYALDQVEGSGEAFARLFTTDGVFKVKGGGTPDVGTPEACGLREATSRTRACCGSTIS